MFSVRPNSSTVDGEPLNRNYVFQAASNRHGLLSIPLATDHSQPGWDAKASGDIAMPDFSHIDTSHYNESHASSARFDDILGIEATEFNHMNDEDDADVSGASMPAALPAVEGSAHPKAWHQQSSINSHIVMDEQMAQSSIPNNSIGPSSRMMRKKAETLRMMINSSSHSDSSQVNSTPDRHTSIASSSRDSLGPHGVKTPDTPTSVDMPGNKSDSRVSQPSSARKVSDIKPRSSIPTCVRSREFGAQSVLAAHSSRFDPFALEKAEYDLLKNHITHPEVTTYLNIRNAILRLWTRSPLTFVTIEEALGCAKESRFFTMAEFAHLWLVRNGYINFGCLHIPTTAGPIRRLKSRSKKQRTIIVIGAGVSGLGCARQLEGLSLQLGSTFTESGEKPPKIIVLEGRGRIGGRVYSHPLKNQAKADLPANLRSTAEMGAQIITGFGHGNPIDILLRGQLGLHYHRLRDNTILYDCDGEVVDGERDVLVEKLYNDILERASVYRNGPPTMQTVKGDENLIWYSREPKHDGDRFISALEESEDVMTVAGTGRRGNKNGKERLAGRAYQLGSGENASKPAAEAAKLMGWQLKPDVPETHTLDLDAISKASEHPTLGQTMDEGIRQYQGIVELTPRDLRLLNWHHANLEYANAASVNQLSLGGWDQDMGNEFEGFHSEVIGGYIQLPRGLWKSPSELDVRFKHAVKTIKYSSSEDDDRAPAVVECYNGEVFEADAVVVTVPLGVLKSQTITFQPPLPDWKTGAIERLGFGLLNKVILVYETSFWDENRDMFGLLNDTPINGSLNQLDYAAGRGRAYLFWNCTKISGRPVLSALMAGNAAHDVEHTDDKTLVQEVTEKLRKMFSPRPVPEPSESIVTRWKRDPFTRGTYSYVGPRSLPGDYDLMAQKHGQLFFAGEATCGTHPATVHGAYLSGLRAASNVLDTLLGPIRVPSPLVERNMQPAGASTVAGTKRKHDDTIDPADTTDTAATPTVTKAEYEAAIIDAILKSIGERPVKPGKAGVNPFLLYTKDFWAPCKEECDKARREATDNPKAKASREEIRATVGKWWRTASEEVKQPYLAAGQKAQEDAARNAAEFKENVATWDREAEKIRRDYMAAHPTPAGFRGRTSIEAGGGRAGTRRKVSSS